MTGRARVFALLARAEVVRLADLGRAMGQAQGDLARAEAMEGRLRQAVQGLQRVGGTVTAASLRDSGLMITRLAAEAALQEAAAGAAQERIAAIRTRMVCHDLRHRNASEAARNARLAEAGSVQDRREACQAVPRRR